LVWARQVLGGVNISVPGFAAEIQPGRHTRRLVAAGGLFRGCSVRATAEVQR
jgi:hypothetical protein